MHPLADFVIKSHMPLTERLYYQDSHLIEFEARVIEKSERVSGWTAVTLNRTAFYPTGGGQPSDTGSLNDSRVVECIDDEGVIFHVIQGRPPEIGAVVQGRIDWARRLDHIQQHTGQHILSQAFVALFEAPTRSFRVLDESCEIDVEISDLSDAIIERAVRLANNVIWEDRAVTIREVLAAEAARLPLRKESVHAGECRLVEIENFDLTPCGGTHAYRTGEVGMIAVRSWQRAKGLTRIEFVAGGRALADYKRANNAARSVAALFSAGRDDAVELAARMLEENKELHRRIRALEEIAARVEAEELLAKTMSHYAEHADRSTVRIPPAKTTYSLADAGEVDFDLEAGLSETAPLEIASSQPPPTIVSETFSNRDAESLKCLALALIAHEGTIALLGSQDNDTARLVFARSPDAPGDMNQLMREACVLLEGRSGGKVDLAQGGGHRVEQLDEALDNAARALTML